jgi:7tm Odorant receptor
VSTPGTRLALSLAKILFDKGYGICGGINITFVVMLCGQFDVLYASLKNLTREDFSSENEELNQYLIIDEQCDTDEGKQEETCDIKLAFVDCVKHHQVILEYARMLEDFFRWFMLPKLFYSGAVLRLDNSA